MYVLTRHIDRRRAILAVLLAAKPAALSITEIANRLRDDGIEPPENKQLSDLLRNQLHVGHVVKCSRATFTIGFISRTGEWRIGNWRLLSERAAQRPPKTQGTD